MCQFGESSALQGIILNSLKNVLLLRGPESQTDLNAVNQFLRSRASRPDSTTKSIQARNRFTDKIDEIDRNSRNLNLRNFDLGATLLSLLNNI